MYGRVADYTWTYVALPSEISRVLTALTAWPRLIDRLPASPLGDAGFFSPAFRVSANRWQLQIRLATLSDVDAELRTWLSQAYELARRGKSAQGAQLWRSGD